MAYETNRNINKNKKIKSQKQTFNNKLNKNFQKKKAFSLTIVHWNCNGLSSKINQLNTYLTNNSPDILTLNELKCNSNSAIYNLNQLSYNSIYKLRENSNGGGVAILINSNIKFEEINLEQYNEEIVGIKIITESNTELNIFSYYNPPQTTLCKEIFDDIEKMYENYIICGDLNSKSFVFNCKSENSNGNILEDIIINNNCQNINDGIFSPKFHTVTVNTNYHELLDFFVGSPIFGGNLEDYSVENNDLLESDHWAIKAPFEFDKKIQKSQINI